MKKILFAASEVYPFIKTGGLADVAGSLPKYFDKKKYDVRVIMPKYLAIPKKYSRKMKPITKFEMKLGWRKQYVGIFAMKYENIIFYFIENDYYFAGDSPYHHIYEDMEKFAYFSRAVLSVLPLIDFCPDIIHCHDWQTGLIPVYLKDTFSEGKFYQGIKSVLTIHNMKFQGRWNLQAVKDMTGLADRYFISEKLESYGEANYLKGGIVYADIVTAVSENYANEIKTPMGGEGLDGLMRQKGKQLVGIINGIDYEEYNPETDQNIYYYYNNSNFRKEKMKNKRALQEELGLPKDNKKFMIGMVSRLTGQKGFDLIDYMMEEICTEDVQLVILGTGEEKYEHLFRHYEWKYHDRVSANIFYSNERAHKIYAGCDAFLMPSLFEPCGLSQLMSLRYGTVPIVRETGGLKDTIISYKEYKEIGNGFCFKNFDAHEMMDTISYAKNIYFEKKREWNKIVERGMKQDFSWKASAEKYEKIYEQLIQ